MRQALDATALAVLVERANQRMNDLKLSQVDVVKRSGISQPRVSQILRGHSNGLTLGVVLGLARALECSLEYLVGLSDHPNVDVPEFFLDITHRAETGTYRRRPMPGVVYAQYAAPPCPWPKYRDRRHFAVQISDDMMMPRYQPGAYALAIELPELPVIDGAEYVIQVASLDPELVETIIRRVRHIPGGTELIATGNPAETRVIPHRLDTDMGKPIYAIGMVYGRQDLDAVSPIP